MSRRARRFGGRVLVGVAAAMALGVGTAVPAGAAPVNGEPPAAVRLPALDPDLLARAIAGLPSHDVTGALVRIGGPAGRWSGTSGMGDLARNTPVSANGLFRIGSITKTFTAVVVLQLAAEHRIGLDQPVGRYLPGLLPDSYPQITVAELLNHTSGLPISTEDAGFSDPAYFVAHRFDGWTPRQIVDSATAQPMQFTPGTKQQYNGVNYFLAGLLIERVTGRSFAAEVRDRITRPLGLPDTYVPGDREFGIRGPHSHGYVDVDGTLLDITRQNPYSWAEGGMISTGADLTRFLRALFRGRLLPPAQLAEMFTVPDVPYVGSGGSCATGPEAGQSCLSMGLDRTRLPNGVTVWGKSGGVPGYTNAVFATRDLRRILVYSLNPTGDRDGSEAPYVGALAAATFDPALGASQ